mmetsp:Transcript_56062/g.67283  ORF Transcript_56062/g.67283 Transcript_56062/m.67283 type:complete len:129 (-) Transcript_56062:62-448(-)
MICSPLLGLMVTLRAKLVGINLLNALTWKINVITRMMQNCALSPVNSATRMTNVIVRHVQCDTNVEVRERMENVNSHSILLFELVTRTRLPDILIFRCLPSTLQFLILLVPNKCLNFFAQKLLFYYSK